jgi:peptidoglycan-associated lipoprotein
VEALPKKPEGVRIADVNGALEDVYFGYDTFDVSREALEVLRRDAILLCAILADFPGLKVMIEGHCDERGSAEYNLGLGEQRARRAEEVLREYGVPAGAVEVISYGKESPQCTEAKESCWQKNRRAHVEVRK